MDAMNCRSSTRVWVRAEALWMSRTNSNPTRCRTPGCPWRSLCSHVRALDGNQPMNMKRRKVLVVSDDVLFRITKYGVATAANIPDYRSTMPAFEGVLTDAKSLPCFANDLRRPLRAGTRLPHGAAAAPVRSGSLRPRRLARRARRSAASSDRAGSPPC